MAIITMKKIAILIPCRNEVNAIANVLRSFPYKEALARGFELNVIVIDNASTDRTAKVARGCGATVVSEPCVGKGNAMRTGFSHVPSDADYVVMLDGDATYRGEEVLRMVEPLDTGFSEVVIGSRLAGNIRPGAMSWFNRIGNWMFSFLVRVGYRANVTDVLTGYFAWKREALMRLVPHLVSHGFGLEMEMVTKMARIGERICCVPISYNPRKGTSNLHPVRDGFRIFVVWLRNLVWHPLCAPDMRVTRAGTP